MTVLHKAASIAALATIFLGKATAQQINCPVNLISNSFVTAVTQANQSSVVSDIVASSAIPVGDNSTCTSVVLMSDALASGNVTPAQLSQYTQAVAAQVTAGDYLFQFTWRRADGTQFTTLGVTDSLFRLIFEPIQAATGTVSTSQGVGIDTTDSTVLTLTYSYFIRNLLNITTVESEQKTTVITEDNKTIEDESETISFITAPLWTAAATVVPQKIVLDGIECKKAAVTLTFVNGFKSLKVAAGAGGFSGSVEVQGNLGASGQIQWVAIVCSDGRALLDGVPVSDPAWFITRTQGPPQERVFTGLPPFSAITIHNGDPGLTNVALTVNRRHFEVDDLRDNQTRRVDVASAMVAGNNNTVTVEIRGKPGGTGEIVIP